MKIVAHAAVIIAAAFVLFGIPYSAFANWHSFELFIDSAGSDLVSSATVVQESPSGEYTIFINGAVHTDEDELGRWLLFFAGEDTPLIMEDITCVVLVEDPSGYEMAKSLQSRLPENQMTIRVEQGVLALSKADAGMFDVLIMSDEIAESFGASTVEALPDTKVVHR